MLTREQKQELANSLTHGIGLLASLVGVVLLLALSVQTGSRLAVGAAALYSFSLLLTFGSSTLYHSLPHPGAKRVLRILDHVAIYFLIGGSYTPFVLLYLDTEQSWPFLGLLWGLIALGVVYKTWWLDKAPAFSVAFYLGLGWMVLLIARPLFSQLPLFCIWTIALGGFFYTAGVIFFIWKRYTYHHAIWHLFVIGGSASHYLAILYGLGRQVPVG
jgi:hemolysin III